MRRIILIIGFLGIVFTIDAQDYKKLASQICDSINNIKIVDPDSLFYAQLDIQEKVIQESFIKKIDDYEPDIINNFYILNYRVSRELAQNCPKYKNRYYPPPFSSVTDFDSVFSNSQEDSLENLITKIKIRNGLQIVIMEIDDLFPYNNMDDYSFDMLKKWNIGEKSSKGGIIIVFSKSLRKIRISTSEIAQKYLSDSDCQTIIESIMIQSFKNGQYFLGIYNSLREIRKKI